MSLMVQLHWLAVSYRIMFKLLLFTFKGIYESAPKYICDTFKLYSSGYSLRRNSTIDEIEFEFGNIVQPIQQQSEDRWRSIAQVYKFCSLQFIAFCRQS